MIKFYTSLIFVSMCLINMTNTCILPCLSITDLTQNMDLKLQRLRIIQNESKHPGIPYLFHLSNFLIKFIYMYWNFFWINYDTFISPVHPYMFNHTTKLIQNAELLRLNHTEILVQCKHVQLVLERHLVLFTCQSLAVTLHQVSLYGLAYFPLSYWDN